MNSDRNLFLIGWFLFLICLALPSITIAGVFFGSSDIQLGLEAAIAAVIAFPNLFDSFAEFRVCFIGIGNIFALLSIFLLLKWNKIFGIMFLILISLTFVFSIVLSFVPDSIGRPYHIGYYVWVLALLLLSIAIGRKVFISSSS